MIWSTAALYEGKKACFMLCACDLCVYTCVNPDGISVNHHLKAKNTALLIYISDVHLRPFSRTLADSRGNSVVKGHVRMIKRNCCKRTCENTTCKMNNTAVATVHHADWLHLFRFYDVNCKFKFAFKTFTLLLLQHKGPLSSSLKRAALDWKT